MKWDETAKPGQFEADMAAGRAALEALPEPAATGWHMHLATHHAVLDDRCDCSHRLPVLVLPLDGLEETIARVLGEHGWTWKAFTQRPTEAECTAPGCDWTWRVPLGGDIDPVAIHEAEKAHRADAIARAIAGDGAR